MAFTFISHGSKHLEIASDDNHRFRFGVVRDERGNPTIVCEDHWKNGSRAETHDAAVEDAERFASVCASQFGLM